MQIERKEVSMMSNKMLTLTWLIILGVACAVVVGGRLALRLRSRK